MVEEYFLPFTFTRFQLSEHPIIPSHLQIHQSDYLSNIKSLPFGEHSTTTTNLYEALMAIKNTS